MVLWGFGQKSKMVDQDGFQSEMITQLLRQVMSSPHDADVKGDFTGILTTLQVSLS